jgi:hypothetical protein
MSDDNPQNRRVSPVDLFLSGQFKLDASAAQAWPVVLDYTAWQTYPIAENVSGQPGELGEVVRLRKVAESFETPPYFARTVALEPGRRIVWKVYPEKSGKEEVFLGAVGFSGYVDFQVSEAGEDSALFSYNAIYEYLVSHEEDSELSGFRAKSSAEIEVMYDAMWDRLRELVAETRPTRVGR